MSAYILERDFDPALSMDDFIQMAKEGIPCMQIYRVQWQESFLAPDGTRLYCHFNAPDAEAIRGVLRMENAPYRDIWNSDIQDTGEDVSGMNVMVERNFPEPVNFDDIAAIEEKGAWCLDAHNVKFIRSFFSNDRKRMLCLYHAPDAESVKQSQIKAEMPFDEIWACQRLTPEWIEKVA